MQTPSYPNLLFPYGFTERDAFESHSRGYCGPVLVEFENGIRFQVCFYDPCRLSQDLETSTEFGEPYQAHPGLILIPEVTLDYMKYAVDSLAKSKFFESLAPLKETIPFP